MKRKRRQSGFVLLLVLVVLAVGGTLLTIAARRCGQDAIRAAAAQRDLQLRWGQWSCQTTLLPVADQMMQDLDAERDAHAAPSCELRQQVRLGELEFTLLVGDESAKANVNTLAARGVEFIGPDKGLLACGYEGIGRLWPTEKIIERVQKLLP